MKDLFNPTLNFILQAIKSDQYYVNITDLMDWCLDEGYFQTFKNNITFIMFVIYQHNQTHKEHRDNF